MKKTIAKETLAAEAPLESASLLDRTDRRILNLLQQTTKSLI